MTASKENVREVIRKPVAERSTVLIRAKLQDHDKPPAPIGSGRLVSLTLTLSDQASGQIQGGRSAQNVLGENGGQVGVDGLLNMLLKGPDLAIVNDAAPLEWKVALFEWVYDTDLPGKYEVWFPVENLSKVL